MAACSSDALTVTFPLPSGLDPQTPALRDDATNAFISYGALNSLVDQWADRLRRPRSLAFLCIPNTIDGVAALLGCWKAGHAVALLDTNLPEASREELVDLYQPELIIRPGADGTLMIADKVQGAPLHDDLWLLLSTSGSTGSPKFVRLSRDNVVSNALGIAEVLDIRADEVCCAHLPLHYSYGLSVLTSHLICGAPILLTSRAFTDREFWPMARDARIAHLPGVPFHFQMMQRLRYERLNLPDLRVLTQAGGALDLESREIAHTFMDGRGGRFHVMYGQTEAAPRMTTLSHEDFKVAPASVGTALPPGKFLVRDDDGSPVATGVDGLIAYEGPNVMLGYAEKREDLALGDVQGGKLETGDIGHLDEAGRLTITGRAKRFGKVYGLRVNLDEIESHLSLGGTAIAVVQKGDQIHVFVLSDGQTQDDIVAELAARYTIPKTAYRFHLLDALPYTDRGKLDYRSLEALV